MFLVFYTIHLFDCPRHLNQWKCQKGDLKILEVTNPILSRHHPHYRRPCFLNCRTFLKMVPRQFYRKLLAVNGFSCQIIQKGFLQINYGFIRTSIKRILLFRWKFEELKRVVVVKTCKYLVPTIQHFIFIDSNYICPHWNRWIRYINVNILLF